MERERKEGWKRKERGGEEAGRGGKEGEREEGKAVMSSLAQGRVCYM